MTDTPWSALVAEAARLPEGPAKLALLDEAVRLADAHGDTAAAFALRNETYIPACHEAGRPDKFLVAFTWCLAWCDREPARFDATRFCWEHFFLLLQAVRDSPDIPRDRAEAVLAELLHRLREPGPMTWGLYEQAAMLPARLGDLAKAAEYWEKRCRLRHNMSASLQFDSQGFEVCYYLRSGDEPAALRAADTLLEWARRGRDTGSLAWVSAHLLSPLLRAGRADEARHWQPIGYREMRAQVIRLGEIARHIEFLAATNDLDAAVRLFERHVGWLFLSRETIDLFHIHAAGWLLAERLRSRGPSIRLRLPKELACHRPDGDYPLDDLSAHFGREMRAIAGRYDARAGNDWFSRTTLTPLLALAELPTSGSRPSAGKGWNKG